MLRFPSKEALIRLVKGGREGGRLFDGAIVEHRDGGALMLRVQRERERERIRKRLSFSYLATTYSPYLGAGQLGIFGLLRMLSCKVYARLILDNSAQNDNALFGCGPGASLMERRVSTRQAALAKKCVLAAVKLIFRYWAALLDFWHGGGRLVIRQQGGSVACLLFHVILQSLAKAGMEWELWEFMQGSRFGLGRIGVTTFSC